MLLDWRHLPFRRFFRAGFFVPVTMSLAVVALVFQLIYAKEGGLLNQLIQAAGLPYCVDWLGDTGVALWSIVALARLARHRVLRDHRWRACRTSRRSCTRSPPSTGPAPGRASADHAAPPPAGARVRRHHVVHLGAPALRRAVDPDQGRPVNATLTMVIYLYQHSFQYELGFGASIAYVLTMLIAVLSLVQLKLGAAESSR